MTHYENTMEPLDLRLLDAVVTNLKRNPLHNKVDDSLRDINSLLQSYNPQNSYEKPSVFQSRLRNLSSPSFPSFHNQQQSQPFEERPLLKNRPTSPNLNTSYYEEDSSNPLNTHPSNLLNHFDHRNHYFNPPTNNNHQHHHLNIPTKQQSSSLFHNTFPSPQLSHHHYSGTDKNPPSLTNPFVDTTCLDEILTDTEMSKSSPFWKSSFNGIKERYSNGYFNDSPSSDNEYSSSNRGYSLPRRSKTPTASYLSKSSSQHDGFRNYENGGSSILQAALERKYHEAPELSPHTSYVRKPGTDLGTYWMSVNRQSPSRNVSAAERLEKLQEPAYLNSYHGGTSKPFTSSTLPTRRPGNHSVASKAAIFSTRDDIDSDRLSAANDFARSLVSNSKIDLSYLDDAVAELAIKNGHHQLSGSMFNGSAGLNKFPTSQINSPVVSRKVVTTTVMHSPSLDLGSDTSQHSNIHDLPHPKPKHNLREQLMNATMASSQIFDRQTSPSRIMFPVMNTGAVASKVTTFELKTSSPTPPNLLALASQLNGNGQFMTSEDISRSTSSSPCHTPTSLSPKSTVFRTKPVLHIDSNSFYHTPSKEHLYGLQSPTNSSTTYSLSNGVASVTSHSTSNGKDGSVTVSLWFIKSKLGISLPKIRMFLQTKCKELYVGIKNVMT
uniref:GATA-type domain-containing protein n=1 Tax=Rhabditophanes sp. KR3021 TaxID=114890 RepID=A0AC35TQU9_9BILA